MRKVLAFMGALLLFNLLLFTILFASGLGPRLIMPVGNFFLTGNLFLKEVSGTFISGVAVKGARYEEGRNIIDIDTLNLSIDLPAILEGEFFLDVLNISGIRVKLSNEEDSEHTAISLNVPFAIGVRSLVVRNLSVDLEGEDPIGPVSLVEASGLNLEKDLVSVVKVVARLPGVEATGSGSIRIAEPYPVDLSVNYRFDADAIPPVKGRVQIEGSLSQLVVKIENDLPVAVKANFEINQPFSAFKWHGVIESNSIPIADIHPEWSDFRLNDAVVKGSGSGVHYQLSLGAAVFYKDPSTVLQLTAELNGDDRSVRVNTASLSSLFGQLDASCKIDFKDDLLWQGHLNGTEINPEFILSQWPGKLDLAASFSGTKTVDSLKGLIEIDHLSGVLRGYPVEGETVVQLSNDQLAFDDLNLRSGGSVLKFAGVVGKELEASLSFHSPDLAEILPELSGQADIAGDIGGSATAPGIDLELHVSGLGYRKTELLDATVRIKTMLPAGNIDGVATLHGFSLDNKTYLEQADLKLHGTVDRHDIYARITGRMAEIFLRSSGTMNNLTWKGMVNAIDIRSEGYGQWALEGKPSLLLSPEEVKLDPLCIQSVENGRICVSGQREKDGSWKAGGSVADIPVDLLEQKADNEIPIAGLVQGTIQATGINERLENGSFELKLTDPRLDDSVPEVFRSSVEIKTNGLAGQLKENRLNASLDLTLKDGSFLRGEAFIDKFAQVLKTPGQCMVNAAVDLSLADITPLASQFKDTAALSGSLKGALSATGTLEKPRFDGSVLLRNGEAVVPQLGVKLIPLKATLVGDNDALRFEGEGWSGGGWIKAEGKLSLSESASPGVVVKLSGNEFVAVNLTEMKVTATPEMDITVDRGQVIAQGSIYIPHARIVPQDLSDAISPSTDVVVGNGAGKKNGFPIQSRIRISTGDDVYVDAYGLKGRLKGELMVVDDPNRPTTGSGTLNIEDGSFSLLGRELSLNVGRLIFSGGQLNDPGVEFRSEKITEGVKTGLEVTGFLKRPVLRLYSDPYMDQQEILSRLLTAEAIGGSSRDDLGTIGRLASSVGLADLATLLTQTKKTLHIDDIRLETGDKFDSISLIIGSWLTPRFYVSYGRDLVNETGSFNTRYSLGRGFFLKTETGATQSGGDLKYEVKR